MAFSAPNSRQGSASLTFLRSPNDIPPRTSSAHAHHSPSKAPAARPVPESALLSAGRSDHEAHGPKAKSFGALLATAAPQATAHVAAAMARPNPSRYATQDFHARRAWSDYNEKVLMGPYNYLDSHPGKDVRGQMIRAFDAWLEVPSESLDIIKRVVAMLHTASLLVDDVEDNSMLRRGLPVAHSIYGVPQTINNANYVYFCALQEVQKLKNASAISIFTEELLNLHRGQGMDLYWRDALSCPSEDEYLEMVSNKTGGLFRLSIKLMQAESGRPVDCVPLVDVMGLLFQIQDDYQNLHSAQYRDNKGMCEDLTEGKFSFPVIHAIRSDPTNLQLLYTLKQKTDNEEVKRVAVRYMESKGSFEYTRRVLRVLDARARSMVDQMDEGQGGATGKGKRVHQILDQLVVEG